MFGSNVNGEARPQQIELAVARVYVVIVQRSQKLPQHFINGVVIVG